MFESNKVYFTSLQTSQNNKRQEKNIKEYFDELIKIIEKMK